MGQKRIMLNENEVHVWQLSLDTLTSYRGRWERFLSPSEKNRSDRFVYEKDRLRYTICHGVLRELLGSYLGCQGTELDISSDSSGKPFLPGKRLKFNLSHSGKFALIAVTNDSDLGIDIEYGNPNIDFLDLAKANFSNSEYQEIAQSHKEDQPLLFYRCWTAKEALVKAEGRGLSIPLNSFSISLNAPKTHTVTLDLIGNKPTHWMLSPIEVNDSYFGSLAYEGKEQELLVREYIPE